MDSKPSCAHITLTLVCGESLTVTPAVEGALVVPAGPSPHFPRSPPMLLIVLYTSRVPSVWQNSETRTWNGGIASLCLQIHGLAAEDRGSISLCKYIRIHMSITSNSKASSSTCASRWSFAGLLTLDDTTYCSYLLHSSFWSSLFLPHPHSTTRTSYPSRPLTFSSTMSVFSAGLTWDTYRWCLSSMLG